jgi:L-threonylcarbamoyladenylate synthase
VKRLPAIDANIRAAAEILKAGGLVAFPTETVYGLGGDGFNPVALAKIFEAKRRPHFDPLIIHIAEMAALERVADTQSLSPKLALICSRLWPGPLTLILPKRASVPDLATSGLPTVAVRFPDHIVAQKLILYSTGAVAAPSANPFGYLSPTRAEHVAEQLGDRVDLILDGGRTGIGVESTILDVSVEPPRILRPGGTEREKIEALIGPVESGPAGGGEGGEAASVPASPASISGGRPKSPGQLKSHYAPRTPLVLHSGGEMLALKQNPRAAYLFFDGRTRDAWSGGKDNGSKEGGGAESGGNVYALSEGGDRLEAAANLFDLLHTIDKIGAEVVHAQQAPAEGLGLAINDRLARAAAKRED